MIYRQNQLVKKFRELGYTKIGATEFINDFSKIIGDILENGDSVSFKGIGMLHVVRSATKKVYNFKQDAVIDMPPRNRIVFVMSDILKNKIYKDKLY